MRIEAGAGRGGVRGVAVSVMTSLSSFWWTVVDAVSAEQGALRGDLLLE